MSRGVIVGYDGSACAKEALRTAVEVARAYGDPLTVVFGYEVNPMGGEVKDYADAVKDLATRRLDEARALVGTEIDAEAVIVEREAAHGLAELAKDRNARVIVVGTNGEGPLRGALLGSTPHKLLQLADRPVLVVPPTD